MDLNAINERLCTIREHVKFYNICSRYAVKIIFDDFNAKIGKKPIYRRCIGLPLE